MPKISAVLITKDEEKNITECLSGLKFCDEIIVVDSGSKDKTVEIARSLGASVHSHAFVNFADQKNFGIRLARGEWVLLIDADERVSQVLGEEIRRIVSRGPLDGYFILRSNRIFGRWMKRGIHAGDYQLRLVQKNRALFRGLVHERIYLNGKIGKLKEPLLHYSTPTISVYMNKLNAYTALEAQGFADRQKSFSLPKLIGRPFLVFIRDAFLKRGVSDGIEGFFFVVLSAYYDFVNQAKLWERSR